MKIIVFHLFNDYSGSPKVLKSVVERLLKDGKDVDLVTSRGGVLDELHGDKLQRHSYYYQFSMNPIVTLLRYLYAQFFSFFYALHFICQKDVVFYVNTILPVGAAVAGKLTGKKVIYHYHENAFAKSAYYRTLAWIMQRCASSIICVSEYQRSFLKRKENVYVVPNALAPSFTEGLVYDAKKSYETQTILMVASLKKYKGIVQFFDIASDLPQFKFVIVLNDTQETINDFIEKEKIVLSDNVTIYPRQENVAQFYRNASIVLNLSDIRMVVETFGLTVLEAMSTGLPVIVPTIGGVSELVIDNHNGFKIDVCDLERIRITINKILTDFELYSKLSQEAYNMSKAYTSDKILGRISMIVESEINKIE